MTNDKLRDLLGPIARDPDRLWLALEGAAFTLANDYGRGTAIRSRAFTPEQTHLICLLGRDVVDDVNARFPRPDSGP